MVERRLAEKAAAVAAAERDWSFMMGWVQRRSRRTRMRQATSSLGRAGDAGGVGAACFSYDMVT